MNEKPPVAMEEKGNRIPAPLLATLRETKSIDVTL
jgi:hypothetical protein